MKRDPIREQASAWVALKNGRTLTLNEQADLAQWRAADPRHEAVYSRLEATWGRLDQLSVFPHSPDRSPDPDLLAPARQKARWPVAIPLAAAACFALAFILWRTTERSREQAPAIARAPSSPLIALPDGSTVELNADSDIAPAFTPTGRTVKLVRGEAHFTVVRNPTSPFVVEAQGVAVKALGTAFAVKLAAGQVEVIVTEGVVQVTRSATASSSSETIVPTLAAGQKIAVPVHPEDSAPPTPVVTLAPAEIDRALAWQRSRFTFEDMPLGELVARFNQSAPAGASRMVLGDPQLGTIRITGRVRMDNPESLIEVLESALRIEARRDSHGEIIFRKAVRP